MFQPRQIRVPWQGTFKMYPICTHWAHWGYLLSVTTMCSACAQWVLDPLSPVSLQAVEDKYCSQQPAQGRSSSPLPASSPPPMSSPSSEFTLMLSAIPSSSPSSESSITLAESDEPPATTRRWVVFRGRVPGVYTSS